MNIFYKRSDFFRTLGYEKGIPMQKVEHIEYLNDKVYIASRNDLVVLDKKTKKIVDSKLSDLINQNNTFIDDMKITSEKIYMILNGKIYVFNKNEKINTERFKSINNSTNVERVYGFDDIIFFTSEKGILNSAGTHIISSTQYFNYKVNDIILIDDILFIGTTGGLAVYDFVNKELINFYDFSFIKNIFDMEHVNEFLVILSNAGLIKLRLIQ